MIKNSILIGLSFLISKILGLLREMLLASEFGVKAASASHNLDAYYAAFKLPDFIFTMISSGVIAAAFVPLFIEYHSRNKEKAQQFASDSLYALSSFILLTSIIFFFGAPYFMRILVPGFSGEVFDTTVNLTRLMLITPIIFTINGIFSGINNSLNKFKGIALAPIMYNLGIIAGIIFWSKEYGLYGVAFGVILGTVAGMLIQMPEALRAGITLTIPRAIWNNNVKRLLTLALPRIAGMSITQISLIVDTFMASMLASGSLTYMNISTNLYFVPVGVIGISIGVTRFGQLSALALDEDLSSFIKTVRQSLRTVLFLLVPITVGMILVSRPLVEILFMRGSFTAENARITTQIVQILSIAIIGMSMVQILARAFYALKDTKTPLLIGLVCFILNVTVASIAAFYFDLGVYGLASATAISSSLYALMLTMSLSKKVRHSLIEWREVMKYIFGSLIMVAIAAFFIYKTPQMSNLTHLLGTFVISCAIYFTVLFIIRSTELTQWIAVIKMKIFTL